MAWLKKDDLIRLVQSLETLHINMEKGQPAGMDDLAEHQEQVIDLGNYLEARYRKEDTEELIHLLEGYCEYLYEISQTRTAEERGKISKKAHKLLISAQNHIRNSLPPDKKEVVFLPYKASMWDSLESIYLAAREDESCNAYVIPIPYFDKNPDGSLGKMYYEGDQFPKDIPITSWEEYQIEVNKPDQAYIHNPYDSWNYVTTVHPRFYSSELKKHVGELIYVPYFVLREIEPDDQVAIDGMKHFIQTPGVAYADKVIVQSEKMKQIYVNEFIKWAKEDGLGGHFVDRKYQESRILGLGSPKFDRVARIRREDVEIPEEWEKILRKPDGSRKKVIFYNTSINALLQNNERMIQKMEDVFQVFHENKDEVALLWRPHPLIPSTIKSMRPALWEKYSALVDRYKSEGWGIYDDSADMDRAVVISDAYYGDSSSIVQVYQKTGKPIMIENVDVILN